MTTLSSAALYLSRLILNPRSKQALCDLANAYEMHRTLCRAFPGTEAGGCGRVLWRVDHDRNGGLPVVYVQSEKQPDWMKMTSQFEDYLATSGNTNPACRPISEETFAFRVGRRLAFRLRANPTRKIATSTKAQRLAGQKSNGKRVPLTKSEDQIAWLQRKAEAGGFTLRQIAVRQVKSPGRKADGYKASGKSTHRITLFGVQYEGILEVTDTQKFFQTLCSGIGPAKGLGMGLLSIAPA